MLMRLIGITTALFLITGCGSKEQTAPTPAPPERGEGPAAGETPDEPEPKPPTDPAKPEAPPADRAAAPAPTAALMNPAEATATAPDTFRVKFETTKGDVMIQVNRGWAPRGADRFYNLVRAGYYSDIAFFRVISGFMAQFGIHGDPKVSAVWREAQIQDDPSGVQSNTRGRVTFATAGPNTRTSQLFINFGNNTNLDGMGFAPIGEVVEGMEVIDALHAGYGEGAPRGQGPHQGRLQAEGNAYLRQDFPELDYLVSATVVE